VLDAVYCKGDADESANVDKRVEEEGVVVVEDDRSDITMAGSEATEGLDVGVGAATGEYSIVVVIVIAGVKGDT